LANYGINVTLAKQNTSTVIRSTLSYIQGCPKNVAHFVRLRTQILTNFNFFHFQNHENLTLSLRIPPHLMWVATLHVSCEMSVS